MNKRFFSLLLTLIMLVSLIPAGALSASASGLTTSENAITVLKQLEGYSKTCTGTSTAYTGYGTVCTKSGDHSTHVTSEKEADAALRNELKALDEAVNSFASRNDLSFSANKHDALVLFSFENGTAWTTGTGAFQNAVKSGLRGSEFLNAICKWSASDNDKRRKIEANMYLNGVYDTAAPSRYIMVTFNAAGGTINNQETYVGYYDTVSDTKLNIVPTKSGSVFMGWYCKNSLVSSPSKYTTDIQVEAKWQVGTNKPGDTTVDYKMEASDSVRLYTWKTEKDSKGNEKIVFSSSDYKVKGALTVNSEFIDSKNVRWGRVVTAEKLYKNDNKITSSVPANSWIKLGEVKFASGTGTADTYTMDVLVTITNSYLRVREDASIYATELRQLHLGDQVRIVNTASKDGFLWGQIADSDNDGVCEGWIALMYTNFEEVRPQDNNPVDSYNVIATAIVVKPVNGYVNVRSGAGTNNQIVGALPYQSRVNLYEITYVNGIQWGRYSGGWFCLTYANVEGVDVDKYANSSAVLAYAFTGKIANASEIYTQAGGATPVDQNQLVKDEKLKKENMVKNGSTVTVTNLTAVGDDTWGKISVGWVKVTNADGSAANVTLNTAKYYTVVDGVTVREQPRTDAARVNNLVKGVEFNVNDQAQSKKQIVVVGDTIWGYADKVGENNKSYSGWVNLASKYVARGDAPSGSGQTDTYTGEMATIIGADKVNVRIHHDIYAKILGQIPYGTTVAILGEADGWYKLDYEVDNDPETDSWVNSQYVQVSKGTPSGSGSSGSGAATGTVETGMGIVANTYSGVNVRTGPGTGYAQVGKLLPGTIVEILEVTTKGASKWGRVTEGWVCMDYITMVDNYEILAGLVGGTTGDNGTVTGAETAIYTGEALVDVVVRKTTSKDAAEVRTVGAGSPITMHEILTVTKEVVETLSETETKITKVTEYWARVNDGYILDPANVLELDALDEAVYTITGSETLNVRPGVGTASGDPVYKLKKGDRVVVTKLDIVDGTVWGFIEADAAKTYITDEEGKQVTEFNWSGEGWISLAYATKGVVDVNAGNNNNTGNNNSNTNTNTDPSLGTGSSTGGFVTNPEGYRYTGKVINTSSLNVRAAASQNAEKTTTLSKGTAVVIYETTIAENMAWGRCDAGWVYLYYIDLTPVVSGVIDARVVYNDNTVAYTDMNGSAVAGTYSRMAVVDIYEIVGKMARTDLGWVNTDNLL